MGIVAEDVARVRAASDAVAIVGERVALRRVGRRWVGLCPFHAEKTPSFSLNAEEGLYYCFGCGAKGDVITFVRQLDHLEFAEAVEHLASRAGIEVRHDDAAVSREHQRRSQLVEVMASAVEWYHQRLLNSADASTARAYLRSRGYDGDVVRQFRLGWAPDDWDALSRAWAGSWDRLVDTGLAFVNRRGRRQDTFRGRIMFPIFDVSGDPVAFGGRTLPGGPAPKYVNSSETSLYSKSRILYGLNWARASIVQAGEAVLCEGYTDVIGVARAGVPRAVATCGTAVTDDHIRLLSRFSVRRVVLAYDADSAGQSATERFYEWERRHDLQVSVARLPPGTDPGELGRTDPNGLRAALEDALPLLAFRIDRALARGDMRSPEGRARAAESAMAVVAQHPSELVRDQYVMSVAARCRVDPDRLRARLAGREPPTDRRAPARLRPPIPVAGPETEALKVMLRRPEAMGSRLHDALFADPVALAAYRALLAAPDVHRAIEGAEPAAAALLHRLVAEDSEADPDDVLARLAEGAARRALRDLEGEAREADDPAGYGPVVAWLKVTIEELRDPKTTRDATDRLVGWLVDRFEVEG